MNMRISGVSSAQRYIPSIAAQRMHGQTSDVSQRRFQYRDSNGWNTGQKAFVKPQIQRQSKLQTVEQSWSQKLETSERSQNNGIRFSKKLTMQLNDNPAITSHIVGFVPQQRGIRPILAYTDNTAQLGQKKNDKNQSLAQKFSVLRSEEAQSTTRKTKINTPTDLIKALIMLLRKANKKELSPKNKANLARIKKLIPKIVSQGQFKGNDISEKDRRNLLKAQHLIETRQTR